MNELIVCGSLCESISDAGPTGTFDWQLQLCQCSRPIHVHAIASARAHASEANAAATRTIAHIAHRTVRSPQLTLQAMCLEPRTLHSTPLHSLLAISRLERGGVYGAARFMNDRKSLANCACVLLVPRTRAVACVCAIRLSRLLLGATCIRMSSKVIVPHPCGSLPPRTLPPPLPLDEP